MSRQLRTLLVSFFVLTLCSFGYAQSAQIQGVVTDSSGAIIAKAQVRVVDLRTETERHTETNASGGYAVPALNPSLYKIFVTANGFSTAVSNVITLSVAQVSVLDFKLQVGGTAQEVQVNAENAGINTTDGSVSTVIDRQFVENLPLNGRSFQSLLYITPGVNLNAVTTENSGYSQGQFVVNGQRADANYWMVDGVSGNVGMGMQANPGNSIGGSIGGTNVLGGTSALVSVDALQEFRIVTSSYAPEFGRLPGGQISIATRSGTNSFHGTVFDYFRNTVLDAADWFADNQGLEKASEQQNDFGGVVGGPIVKDKTFFFFSYEGLRVNQPTTFLGTVPDLPSRAKAIPAVQPFLNAYPLPKAGAQPVAGTPDIVTYSATFANPGSADAYSLRMDHQLRTDINLFARYSQAPSKYDQRGAPGLAANVITPVTGITKTATVGATWTKSPQVVNDARFNYSIAGGRLKWVEDGFGGAGPLPGESFLAPGYSYQNSAFLMEAYFGSGMAEFEGPLSRNFQYQYNVVDTVSVQKGSHSLKFGVDYRRMTPYHWTSSEQLSPRFTSMAALEAGQSALTIVWNNGSGQFLLQDLSAFAQDTWRVNSRLNLTYGLRWDVNFSPQVTQGLNFPGLTGFSLTDLSNLAVAPQGAPPYFTRYGNFEPRIGGAYRLRTNQNWDLTMRGGFGVFYGLADTEIGNAVFQTDLYPWGAAAFNTNTSFPAALPIPPIELPNAQNAYTLFGFDPHLKLPYALEWNVAFEQSLGPAQTLTVSYLGASDRNLLQSEAINNPNPNFAAANLVANPGASSYGALQLEFQRRLSHGLQALVGYTWSHSIDNGSYGAYSNGSLGTLNSNRGDSDFDLRNVFSAALTYNVPQLANNLLTRTVTGGWSTDNIVQLRSGPPVDVMDEAFPALTGTDASVLVRPDVVPGQPQYLTGPQYPGRRALNPASFMSPPTVYDPALGADVPTRQGNLGRNARRALGLRQWDFAVHREFPIYESVKLQFRAELFNILNHPNFAPFDTNFGVADPYFGQSTQMLNQALGGGTGNGGQNPLYAPGGPRSGELALKLVF
jgi:hypothetical protein